MGWARSGGISRAKQLPQSVAGVFRAHEGRADEKAVRPGRACALDGRRIVHAGLRHAQAGARDVADQPLEKRDIRGEVAQIATEIGRAHV